MSLNGRVVSGYDEVPRTLEPRTQGAQIVESQAAMTPRRQYAINDANTDAGYAQKLVPIRGIHVYWEIVAIRERPRCFRIDVEIEIAGGHGTREFGSRKLVEAQQPISLI